MNATYECGFESFSTLSTPGEDRLGSWNHLIGGVFPGLKIFSAPDIKARWRACSILWKGAFESLICAQA